MTRNKSDKWKKEKKKEKKLLLTCHERLTYHEQFENSSSLTRWTEWSRSRSIHLYCTIWSSCFQIRSGCLVAVCLHKQENVLYVFVDRVFFLPRIRHSPFYQQGSRRCANGADRKLNEIKAGKSDAQTSCAVAGCSKLWAAQLGMSRRLRDSVRKSWFPHTNSQTCGRRGYSCLEK